MRIVLVDDDETSLFILSTVVQRLDDVEAVSFIDAVGALEWLADNEADLITLDQEMPELDGMGALRRIRANPRLAEVPVVMLTGNSESAVRIAALEAGCNDFVSKPIVVPEVLARFRNLLALRQSRVLLRDRASLLAEEVERATAALHRQGQELVERLSRAAEFRDSETGAHIERMALYTHLIAQAAGYDADFAEQVRQAAPMHDIGKLGIPDVILLKPGRLEPEELAIMRRHTTIGHRILAESAVPLLRLAADIALSHHEKFDGTGYPRGLAGHAIPVAGRMVAVADVFDALTSTRPYKRSWTLEESRAFLLDNSGTHFDPEFVDALFARWDDAVAIHAAHADIEPPLLPADLMRG